MIGRLLAVLVLFLAPMAFAGHSPFHVRCTAQDEDSSLKMVQNHNLQTNVKRLIVTFKTLKGGEFKAGDVIDFQIKGVKVGSVKLRSDSPTELIGKVTIQNATSGLGFEIRKKVPATMGGLSCAFRK